MQITTCKSKRNIVTIESNNNPNAASLMENKLNDNAEIKQPTIDQYS